MKTTIEIHRRELEKRKIIKSELLASKDILEHEMTKITRDLKNHEEAKEIIRTVGLKTQEQIKFHISDITSLALESVFTNPYKLELEFVQRRNKTECDIYFARNGNRINPLDSGGYGQVDVASFALRIASLLLKRKEVRPTIIMDEPMKWVSDKFRNSVASMFKNLSDQLGIQFIIATHDTALTRHADKVFSVELINGVSKIKTGIKPAYSLAFL